MLVQNYDSLTHSLRYSFCGKQEEDVLEDKRRMEGPRRRSRIRRGRRRSRRRSRSRRGRKRGRKRSRRGPRGRRRGRRRRRRGPGEGLWAPRPWCQCSAEHGEKPNTEPAPPHCNPSPRALYIHCIYPRAVRRALLYPTYCHYCTTLFTLNFCT